MKSMGTLMDEFFSDDIIEPRLQPLQGESFGKLTTTRDHEAKLDFEAIRLWESRFTRTYFELRVFNSNA